MLSNSFGMSYAVVLLLGYSAVGLGVLAAMVLFRGWR